MRHNGFAARLAGATSAIAAVAIILGGATAAAAQERPASPTELPPVPPITLRQDGMGRSPTQPSYKIEYVRNAHPVPATSNTAT